MKPIDKELENLNILLIQMCDVVNNNISQSIADIIQFDKNREVNDKIVDDYEKLIENKCIEIIISNQPVAKDLRLITGILKIITDLERIGDHAEDILKYSKKLNECKIYRRDRLIEMSKIANKMVLNAIESFIKMDLNQANEVIEMDDQLDFLYDDIRFDLIKLGKNDSSYTDTIVYSILISKYLERIGDHAVNIAEWVIYVIKGFHKEKKYEV